MYGWIWRRLPFGLPGKIGGSLLLATAAAAVLWYVVFPKIEPLMPFDDVQVTREGGTSVTVDGSAEPDLGPDEIPYDTTSNNPVPSATSGR